VLAIIPGTSRSGATIIGGILIGLSRPIAAEYTFYLAIPTMLGASVLKIAKFGGHFTALGGSRTRGRHDRAFPCLDGRHPFPDAVYPQT
jgi:undecaprenyl pyrophosphate phosphatase UppP